MQPLLSIVVPTKDRFQYLCHTIKSLTEIDHPEIEIIIYDNSSVEHNLVYSDIIADRRIKYFRDTTNLSMSQNYEKAVDKSTGIYVCVIGDDDSVTKDVVQITSWAKFYDLDVIVTPSLINYVWPDLNMGKGNMASGQLVIRSFNLDLYKVQPKQELIKSLNKAAQSFECMPKLYYGIVKRQILNNIKLKTGRFFPGISPDMSAAISIALNSKNAWYIDYPVFVPGSSLNSNAGLSGLNRHIGWVRDQPHLDSDSETKWSKVVPCFYSVQTVWAEAAVESIIANGSKELLKEFNVAELYAQCILYHTKYYIFSRSNYYTALKFANQNLVLGSFNLLKLIFSKIGRRLRRIVYNKFSESSSANDNIFCQDSVADVGLAVKHVEDFLSQYRLQLNDFLDKTKPC